MRRRRGAWRYGLRFRVAATFALGGLTLSAILAVLTYVLADRYLTDQRQRSAERQAYLHARFVRDDLRRGEDDAIALAMLDLPSDRAVVLHHGGQWLTTSRPVTRASLPVEIRQVVAHGGVVRERVTLDGQPTLVVALPIPELSAEFYMTFSLSELANTLSVLGNVLLGVAGATTFAAAILGLWAGRRVMRPLAEVGSAAQTIAGGDLAARLVVADDPDLAQLAASFNAMVDALQARIERDARFASDVSHELRSPLTTLTSALSVLDRRRADLSPRATEALDLLAAEVRRFRRLVEELLELARAEAGAVSVDLERRYAETLIRSAVAHHEPGVEVEVATNAAGAQILVDERRLDRVLANLFENAGAYGGGVTRVGIARDDGRVRIEIDDRGPGIPPEQREMVFDRFFRGAVGGRRGTANGTGLGLALVAEHMRLMDGRVTVQDVPGGRGARLVIELPEAAG